ncbi:MAG: hypothetical protein ACETWG_10685 [Candidatus Neomarinimicrobiota bacterium]
MNSYLKPTVLIVSVILFFPSCEEPEENSCYDEYNICGEMNPDWFMELIEEAESELYYMGSVIYQHEYRGSYLFHFEIPVSSCAYCRIYDCDGHLKEWTSQEQFEDYLNNRKDEKVVWHWHD